MAAVAPFNISAHLRHLLLSKNQNCLQRLLLLYRRCLGTNSRRYLGPSGNPTTHAPAWQLYSGVCSRARYYSTASVAVAETVSLSPAVKYLVDTNNISDLSLITPSGPKDRILKGDVLQYLDNIKSGRVPAPPTSTKGAAAATPVVPTQQTSPPSVSTRRPAKSVPVVKMDSKTSPVSRVSFVDVPVDEVQRSHARQMVQSKATTPHIYASATCDVKRLIEMAKSLGDDSGGFEAFLAKAAALTLQRLPECNVVWNSSSDGPEPLVFGSVDVSVTVYSNRGLTSALLKGVNRLSVLELRQAIKDLASGVQAPPTPELQTIDFSIIYLGDSGISDFTAILSPGQSAVLTVGSIDRKLTLPGTDSPVQTRFQQASTVTVTLTADARVYHGDLACRWLDEFRKTVESPDAFGLL